MRVPFGEIAKRLTGLSTPFFGVSWNPPKLDRDVAKRLLGELEDRRILFNASYLEVPDECVRSVVEIRRLLNDSLSDVKRQSLIGQSIRAMRAACRTFLDRINPLATDHGHMNFHQLPLEERWRFDSALAELRVVFGAHLAQLSAAYGIDVEEQLVAIFPAMTK
jgi:hypothetical protein